MDGQHRHLTGLTYENVTMYPRLYHIIFVRVSERSGPSTSTRIGEASCNVQPQRFICRLIREVGEENGDICDNGHEAPSGAFPMAVEGNGRLSKLRRPLICHLLVPHAMGTPLSPHLRLSFTMIALRLYDHRKEHLVAGDGDANKKGPQSMVSDPLVPSSLGSSRDRFSVEALTQS